VIGLPSNTSWQDLKDLMRKAGEVQYTNVLRSGDGVVEFVNIDDKEKALEMFQNYDYNGNTLTVKEVNAFHIGHHYSCKQQW
jgi:arginine/serine-rich splicing factor 4/5/6